MTITQEQLDIILADRDVMDTSKEETEIWKFANILRGPVLEERYKDAILPMFLIRRLECELEESRDTVRVMYNEKPDIAPIALCAASGHPYYNTSEWYLKKLLIDPVNILDNLRDYMSHFSDNVREILSVFKFEDLAAELQKHDRLYPLVKAFSELDYSKKNMDPIKSGYVFENLLGRFGASIMTGEHYTAREIIELMVAIGLSEGMDDVLTKPNKAVSIMDLTCGTGGMLTTAHRVIEKCNPTVTFAMYGKELNPESWALCSAEMLLLGLDDAEIINGNSLVDDPFRFKGIRLALMNPPFGTPWSGEEAPLGSEEAVNAEVRKGAEGRYPGGKPGGGDSQLLFLQNALVDLADNGRAVVVENSSPLVTGGTSSGESQIRRYLLENDYIEAIIKLPANLFANTSLNTFLWVISKNKSKKRYGKIQLINAEKIFHKMRKGIGEKKNELLKDDKMAIVKEYLAFQDSDISQIHDTSEFIYREYTVRQPLQRAYYIDAEHIKTMLDNGTLSSIYDENKYEELLAKEKTTDADKKKIAKFEEGKPKYDAIIEKLMGAEQGQCYKSKDAFMVQFDKLFDDLPKEFKLTKAEKDKIAKGLSEIDKTAEIQKDPKTGEDLYDDATKDTEIVRGNENVDEYMAREVLPYVPDAKWTFEEDLTKKTPVIKTGAEIPFERCFYVYEKPEPSEEIAKRIQDLDRQADALMKELFGDGE